MIKVYIASPYTNGDMAKNVKVQMDCFDELMNHGFAPFIPLLSHFQHLVHPRSYDEWLKLDEEWVEACDYILRLDGESPGADREVAHAFDHGVRIVYSIEELLEATK